MKKVFLYTDGACSGNPGKGGYGAILRYNEFEKEISRGFLLTTNNRMELMGVIDGLSLLKESCEVELYSDSKYVTDAINNGWVYAWKKNGWIKSDKKSAQNVDLWEKLLPLLERHTVTFHWIRGHAGHEFNERCDRLAVGAYNGTELIEDGGFKAEGK